MKKTLKILISLILVLLAITVVFEIYISRTTVFNSGDIELKYPVQFFEVKKEGYLLNLINSRNSIKISLIKKETPKSDLSLEQIMENYNATFSVFYDEYDIQNIEGKEITINDIASIYVANDISKDNLSNRIITILIPMYDKELTLFISGSKSDILLNEKYIDKIIKSIKLK